MFDSISPRLDHSDSSGPISPGWADPEIAAALVRFAGYCEFDPGTGCVIWTGGQTRGGGHSRPYGAFKFKGRRWAAHRWAARYIHGFDIDGLQVDHCCPTHVRPLPDTLCVEHLQALSLADNRELQTLRAREAQTVEQRRYWAHVRAGIEPEPALAGAPADGVPFYPEPVWLQLAKKSPAGRVASGAIEWRG